MSLLYNASCEKRDNVLLSVGETHFVVEAEADITTALTRMIPDAVCNLQYAQRIVPKCVDVVRLGDSWRIRIFGSAEDRRLNYNSQPPQIAGAIMTAIVGQAAVEGNSWILRAPTLYREGVVACICSDAWKPAAIVAGHLHARGWKFLTTDYALIQRGTGNMALVPKLSYITADMIAGLPMAYRRAIEASPWYCTADGVAFYAVDSGILRSKRPYFEITNVVVLSNSQKGDDHAVSPAHLDTVTSLVRSSRRPPLVHRVNRQDPVAASDELEDYAFLHS